MDDPLASLDRRGMLKRAAGLGLAIPVGGFVAAHAARAQELDADPARRPDRLGRGATGHRRRHPDPADAARPLRRWTRSCRRCSPAPSRSPLTAKDATVFVAKDVAYAGWTFDGTIPGPPLRVVAGRRRSPSRSATRRRWPHSLDSHSAQTPPDVNYRTINPGEEFTWSFTPEVPRRLHVPLRHAAGADAHRRRHVRRDDRRSQGGLAAGAGVRLRPERVLPDGRRGRGHGAGLSPRCSATARWTTWSSTATPTSTSRTRSRSRSASRSASSSSMPAPTSGRASTWSARSSTRPTSTPTRPTSWSACSRSRSAPATAPASSSRSTEPGIYPAVNHAFGHAAHGAIALLQAA